MTPQLQQAANDLIKEVFDGLQNLGIVDAFIPAGNHTADFDLPEHHKLRVKEEKQSVYYCIYRA